MSRHTSNQVWEKIQEGVFVIAEIGKNFIQSKEDKPIQYYVESAKQLISCAKEAGADAVKFQTHNVEDEQMEIDVTSPHFSGSDRYSWVKRNTEATPIEFWNEIKKYSEDIGIIFFSTPMSRGAAMKLEEVGVPIWKIGSGDILDFAMLDFIAQTRKPIIISSGMSTLAEIDKSITFLKKRTDKIALMHCVSKYPCPSEDLNLNTIKFFKNRYDMPIGFSDHSLGHESAIAAVGIGATVIEKHFSMSRDLWGADHKTSLTPAEFRELVRGIREKRESTITNYGQEKKILQDGEAVFRPFFRKSLVAGEDIRDGTKLRPEMIYSMRPQGFIGDALHSEEYELVLGRRVRRNLNKYDPICLKDLE